MSAVAEAWVVKHSPYRGSTYHVHKAIAEVVNKEREWLFYGRLVELAKKTRIDRKTIGAAIARMVDDGYLRVVRSPLRADELGGKVGTGRPGIYEFVFVKNAPVIYDADGTHLASDEGEEDSSPLTVGASSNESQAGVSAGPSRATTRAGRSPKGGEEISSPNRGGEESASPGEEISSPGAAFSSPGEEIASRNSIELESELQKELKSPPSPHVVGARGTRVTGTNPRALGTDPRSKGTNPRASTVAAFFADDRRDDPDPVDIGVHLRRMHAALGRGLDTEGAQR